MTLDLNHFPRLFTLYSHTQSDRLMAIDTRQKERPGDGVSRRGATSVILLARLRRKSNLLSFELLCNQILAVAHVLTARVCKRLRVCM